MRSAFEIIQEQIVRLKDQLAGVPRFERGRVTSVSPLRVQLDGADAPLAGAPDNLAVGLGVGDYVQVMIYRHRATIIGAHHSVPTEWRDVLVGDWVGITTASGFGTYAAYGPLQARRTILGTQLRGTIRRNSGGSISNGQVIGQLPSGHRPTQGEFRWAPRGNQQSGMPTLLFLPNGDIIVDTYSTGTFYNVSLDGIIIPTD